MPQKRQELGSEEDMLIRSLALQIAPGERLASHTHSWPQLVYASSGVMTVSTTVGAWVVPPERAAWVPAGMEHEISMTGRVAMRSLYFHPRLARRLPGECSVIHVTHLLRELVLRVIQLGRVNRRIGEQRRLAAVLLDELVGIRSVPLELPLPMDPRARRVALALRAEPARQESLAAIAAGSGASVRTLERLFLRDTGMTFGRWRQQARLLKALSQLAQGESVTEAAMEVGYESTSAFIAMFKRILGETPGRYYRDRPA